MYISAIGSAESTYSFVCVGVFAFDMKLIYFEFPNCNGLHAWVQVYLVCNVAGHANIKKKKCGLLWHFAFGYCNGGIMVFAPQPAVVVAFFPLSRKQ